MSETPFTIRLKISDCEMELTGSRTEVMQTLDELPQIVGKVVEAFNLPQEAKLRPPQQQEAVEAAPQEFPAITAQVGTSCPDAIVSVLSTGWGREKPRYLNEILEAMKVNALHFPEGTVKGRLTDLTKRGMLRRIKGEKGYGYVMAK